MADGAARARCRVEIRPSAIGAGSSGSCEATSTTSSLVALRREPERRYGSVDRVRRTTCGATSTASPSRRGPTRSGTALGKFVRRNRIAVAAPASSSSLPRGGARGHDVAGAPRARRTRRPPPPPRAGRRRVKEFLIGLFEVADPEQSSGGSITASELLDQAGRRLKTELSREPDVQADLLEAVARIDRGLGRLDTAEDLAERSLDDPPAPLPGRRRLDRPQPRDARRGRRCRHGKARRGGEAARAAALQILERKEGPDSLATARARERSRAGALLEGRGQARHRPASAASTRRTGACSATTTSQTAMHLRNLCVLLDELDRIDEAEKAYRDSQASSTSASAPSTPTSARAT